jgi:hypothetical protein
VHLNILNNYSTVNKMEHVKYVVNVKVWCILYYYICKNGNMYCGVLLKEFGTIWCLLSITIDPTITVVVILTVKRHTWLFVYFVPEER